MQLIKWLVIIFLVVPNTSIAECAENFDGIRRALVDHEGQPGVWFAMPVAQCMLRDLQTVNLLNRRTELLEEQLQLRSGQVERLNEIVEIVEEMQAATSTALDRTLSRQRNAEDRVNIWYRQPGFWFAMGIVVSAALVALTAWGLSSVD